MNEIKNKLNRSHESWAEMKTVCRMCEQLVDHLRVLLASKYSTNRRLNYNFTIYRFGNSVNRVKIGSARCLIFASAFQMNRISLLIINVLGDLLFFVQLAACAKVNESAD